MSKEQQELKVKSITGSKLPEIQIRKPQAKQPLSIKEFQYLQECRLKIFLALFDVESRTGGGETIYRQIFRCYPHLEFTYLLESEPPNFPRPANVQGLPLERRYVRNASATSLEMECYCWAKTIANTLRGKEFDVIEIPDYMSDFSLLPAALLQSPNPPAIAVSLHGRSSITYDADEQFGIRQEPARNRLENLLFGLADVRYGISPAYLDEWRAVSPQETHFVNPLAWLILPPFQTPMMAKHPPDLHFVGRLARRKGADLFLEALWRLPRNAYRDSSIIGPSVAPSVGARQLTPLDVMIRSRQLQTRLLGNRSPAELKHLFATRSIIILPSRYDSLNLIALESLFAGCPTVVGTGAGVCRFLSECIPTLPFTKFDVDDVESAAHNIAELLRNYDRVREELAAALQLLTGPPSLPPLDELYRCRQSEPSVRKECFELFEKFERSERATRPTLWRRTKQYAASNRHVAKIALSLQAAVIPTVGTMPTAVRSTSATRQSDCPTASVWLLWSAWKEWRRIIAVCRSLSNNSEATRQMLAPYQDRSLRLGTIHLWTELAKRLLPTEDSLTGAVFALRCLRHCDDTANLPEKSDLAYIRDRVNTVLRAAGFMHEAAVVTRLYGNFGQEERHSQLKAWLYQHRVALRAIDELSIQVRIQNCGRRSPRVSLIVAIDPSSPLTTQWLQHLQNQSLVQNGEAEILFIALGSPESVSASKLLRQGGWERVVCDWALLEIASESSHCQAWNQGLLRSRGSYVSLLTPQEFWQPTGFATLVGLLDQHPEWNWLQAQSLEVTVDARGGYLRDHAVRTFTDFEPAQIAVDWQAVSRIGTVYRRDLHQQTGFFDAGFQVAGELEFVQRAAPALRFATHPQTLCAIHVPISFSIEQQGFQPLVPQRQIIEEIELLRAWDVYRTAIGIRERYQQRPEDLDKAVRSAWRYRPVRKLIGADAVASDIEYAARLSTYAAGLFPHRRNHWTDLSGVLQQMNHLYRQLDRGGWNNSVTAFIGIYRTLRQSQRISRALANVLGPATHPLYFADGRNPLPAGP